ncbi:MAG: GGDEF domain-containing protein [Gammaproteobacteria bacterium]|nr:GGDEF domain-containing protein [Gammaproteobacteria bacterium]
MDSLRSQPEAGFKVYIEMAAPDIVAPIRQWVQDCADLTEVANAELADLKLWDWAAFQYHKQLGDVIPLELTVIEQEHTADKEQQVLMHGADYVAYVDDMDTLLLRLSFSIQRLRYVQTLESLSVSDPLTGVFNRRKFDQELDKCWRQGKRQNAQCSLLMLDVDFFKQFNDTYGHLAGDQCLRELAAIFKQAAVRPHDVVARIGGEEFAIILPDTPLLGAKFVAEQIRQAVSERQILNEVTPLGFVSVSIGVACVRPQGVAKLTHWQQQADDALYAAKAAGRNCIMADVVSAPEPIAEIF